MEATIVLVLVLGLLFGGMTLMLASGFVSTERERARQAEERRPAEASPPAVPASAPLLFLSPRPAVPEMRFVFDDVLISRLEDHVRLEQAVVAHFVDQPSIDTLYHQTGSSFHIH
jgi:hypothetical protein